MRTGGAAASAGFYARHGKRILDLVGATTGLTILSPVMAVTALLVRIGIGAPVIFRQDRPGQNENLFTNLKFRTMTEARAPDGELLSDAERLTRLGRLLRATSLDELPELVNVLKGDMSLVGPRPLLPRYLPFFTARERKRFLVRPGITGLAQISGRNHASWDERLALDVAYVEGLSLTRDVKILMLTLWRTLAREGLEADPQATMEDLDVERQRRSKRAVSPVH